MTTIKPQLSSKNKYYISKHRYYELKHFCLQYPEWKRDYKSLSLEGVETPNLKIPLVGKTTNELSRVETKAMVLEELSHRINIIDAAAEATDPELKNYILAAVTEGRTYENMETYGTGIPCSRDTFYRRYRKFFWMLNSVRG